MRKNFLQRLQKVKLTDILSVFNFLIAIIPAFFYKIICKPFWLICEYSEEARDNAYYFFKYMRKVHPEINCVYAIDKESVDYKRLKGMPVVQYGSIKHWILYLAAQVNISSQKGGKPNAAICYLLEVYEIIRNKRVFLQHGIIKDDLPYVHYEQSKISLFTTSVQREYEYVSRNFGYKNNEVQKLGLCRFDDLVDLSNGDYILVMPTWRQWIAEPDILNRKESSNFSETQYFKRWNDFLSSKELYAMLEKYNKKLVFYPHRNMQKFIKSFYDLNNDRIIIAEFPKYDAHELLKKCSLLITDYSSVAMDFAYLNKPIIYYQFDYKKFRKNHLEEGYFSYINDGFGEVVQSKNQIIKLIENYITSNFKLKEVYKKRINDFFDLRDKKNCERTYKAILNLVKE